MIFTDNINDNGKYKYYYKLAFHESYFSKLLDYEKKRLIIYTIKLLSKNVNVVFDSNFPKKYEIGFYDKSNNNFIINEMYINISGKYISYQIYDFIYNCINKKIIKNLDLENKIKTQNCENNKNHLKDLKNFFQSINLEIIILNEYLNKNTELDVIISKNINKNFERGI